MQAKELLLKVIVVGAIDLEEVWHGVCYNRLAPSKPFVG
jgi:hypothetical protein